MFVAGQILYFRPFHFKNGRESKNKFFIILKNINDVIIVASLPTKVNNAPSLIDKSHGCINYNDRKFNCYVFEQGRIVCENGFSFNLHTFVYGNQVDNYDVINMTSIEEGEKYDLMGVLNKDEFNALIYCIINNNSTKTKIKKLLNSSLAPKF